MELVDYMKGFVDDMFMLSCLEMFVDGLIEIIDLKKMLLDILDYYYRLI